MTKRFDGAAVGEKLVETVRGYVEREKVLTDVRIRLAEDALRSLRERVQVLEDAAQKRRS